MKSTIKKLLVTLLVLSQLFTVIAFAEAEKVIVGTEGAYPPYNFIDAAGQVDGYDAAIIKAIDERIADIEFAFEPTAWDAIFVALESGKFDIIANQISKNPAREEKYIFSQYPYLFGYAAIVYKKGRTDIKTLKDLEGKTVIGGMGTHTTSQLEEYNKANNNAITIQYSDGNIATALTEIANGRVDATLTDPVTAQQYIDELGLELEFALRDDVPPSPVYLLFAKTENGQRYQQLVDAAFLTLIEDGTIAKLSTEWFGADYFTDSYAALVEAQAAATPEPTAKAN